MNRRGFLGAILATGCAPAIVRAESLMKIVAPSQEIELLSYAEFPLKIIPGDVIYYGGSRGGGKSWTLTEIIARTINERKEEIKANITAHNTLLRRLKK